MVTHIFFSRLTGNKWIVTLSGGLLGIIENKGAYIAPLEQLFNSDLITK